MPGEKRLLIYTEAWGTGGIESTVMNLLRSRAFERYGASFDIFTVLETATTFDEEVAARGGTLTSVFTGKNPGLWPKFRAGTAAFAEQVAHKHYTAVHINVTNALGLKYAQVARRAGIVCRVVQSHNAAFDNAGVHPGAKAVAHRAGRMLYGSAPTARLAVSQAAGEFVFGTRPFELIPNGIDCTRFAFDTSARQRLRAELAIPDAALVVGNIAHLTPRKNPTWVVQVLAQLVAAGSDAYAVFVGTGPELEATRAAAAAARVENRVRFCGRTDTPEDYYSLLDVLLFPSLSEGFGMSAVEAQCAGAPVLASEAVPREVDATARIRHLSLDDGAQAWADATLELAQRFPLASRAAAAAEVAQAGYDNEACAERIVAYYEEVPSA